MGFKLVRDQQPDRCRANGVSGQWREAPDPVRALRGKIGEEYGEYAAEGDPAELFDLLDVVARLIQLADPDGVAAAAHAAKVKEMGGFEDLIEWCPVPPTYMHHGGTDPTA